MCFKNFRVGPTPIELFGPPDLIAPASASQPYHKTSQPLQYSDREVPRESRSVEAEMPDAGNGQASLAETAPTERLD